MLVNTQRDTDIVSVSNRTEPEEEKESRTREKALERNKKKLQEKKEETVTEYPDTVDALHEKILSIQQGEKNPENAEESGKNYVVTKGKTIKRKPTKEVLCVNSKVTGAVKDSVQEFASLSLSDAEYAGRQNRSDSDPDYAGMSVVRRSAKAVSGFVLKEILLLVKAIATAVGKLVLVSIGAAIIVVTLAAGVLHSISGTEDEAGEAAAQYDYHSYNQHNYTGQANKACGVTAAASALRSLGLQITPDMLEAHNNGHVGLWYGADAWVNNHYPVNISRAEVSADTIDQALQQGSLCVVYLHNNCDVSSGSSQWNTGRNVSGGCHWITLIGYTEAGLIAALDPADGTGNEEYCRPENCEGGTTDKAISMEEIMESCSNIYVITPTETRTDDEKLLAALIYSEAGASYEDKLAVGTVVMNRLDMQYGGALTLEDVIYAPNQFEGTKTANFRNALANGAPAQCQHVAYEILQEGKRSDKIPSSCVSFMALSISESEMRWRTGCTQFIIIDQRFGW